MGTKVNALKVAIFFLLGLVNSESFASSAPGFFRGNNLTMLNLKGAIKINSPCRPKAPRGFEMIKCESHDLSTGNEDYFVGPVNAAATEVVLVAQSSSGETHTKKVSYEGALGRTAGTVNLWYSTLFQSPLLEMGKNEIHFVLQDDQGHSLESGNFMVNVAEEQEHVCSTTTYSALTGFECNMQKSVCHRYFRKNNLCR